MKIFSSNQLKDWDNYTIKNEGITSNQLMERAARSCYQWITRQFPVSNFKIFCGKGNNGGDGLAIARMLIEGKREVVVYILESGQLGSDDFQNNLSRLYTHTTRIRFIQSADQLPRIKDNDIIVDALFGTGLNKPPEAAVAELIKHLNNSVATSVSIDIPSGLYADRNSIENTIVKADFTLTFQQYKLAFMMAGNENYFGKIVVLDIHLNKAFYEHQDAQSELIDIDLIKAIFRLRKTFSNKGDFGHACLLAGSYGMMGAAVIAAKACVKSGVGKLTCAVSKKGYEIMQASVPEAMCVVYGNNFIKDFSNHQHFNAMGIGPGIGIYASHKELLQGLFNDFKAPMVIDADALNVIAGNKKLLSFLPKNCVITPHPKEFDRLFGKQDNDFERMELALDKSRELGIYIVLKGHHTLITTPYKRAYFNSTGNAGMAKGGSGDVLTGILTGFVAQGYSSLEACLLGVFLHGLAGDFAADEYSQEAMTASNLVESLGRAFKQLTK